MTKTMTKTMTKKQEKESRYALMVIKIVEAVKEANLSAIELHNAVEESKFIIHGWEGAYYLRRMATV